MNKKILISLAGIIDKKGLHEALKRALSFPDYYGGNLDALHDMLTEQGAGTRIVITGAGGMAPELDGYFEVMKKVFADAQSETPDLEIVIEDDADPGTKDGPDDRMAPLTDFDGGWSRRGIGRFAQSTWRSREGETE